MKYLLSLWLFCASLVWAYDANITVAGTVNIGECRFIKTERRHYSSWAEGCPAYSREQGTAFLKSRGYWTDPIPPCNLPDGLPIESFDPEVPQGSELLSEEIISEFDTAYPAYNGATTVAVNGRAITGFCHGLSAGITYDVDIYGGFLQTKQVNRVYAIGECNETDIDYPALENFEEVLFTWNQGQDRTMECSNEEGTVQNQRQTCQNEYRCVKKTCSLPDIEFPELADNQLITSLWNDSEDMSQQCLENKGIIQQERHECISDYRCVVTQETPDDCQQPVASYVVPKNGVFHEDIIVDGTSMTLHYSSRNAFENNERHSNAIAPGWTLSGVHAYRNGILYYGNGSKEAIGATYIADEEQYIVYAKDGVSYLFDSEGRHLLSRETLAQQTISTFAYNDASKVVSHTDRFANVTEIIYDDHGNASKIIAHTGQVTALRFNDSSMLEAISYADGSSYAFVYDEHALMVEESEPNGNVFTHRFNKEGKIVEIIDAEYGIWSFDTLTNGAMTQSSMTLAEGDKMVFTNYPLENNEQRSVIKRPNGEEVVIITSADRSQKIRQECGVTRIENLSTDPLTGNDVRTSVTTVQPSGLTSETAYNIDYTYNGDGAVIGKKVQTSKNGSTTDFYEDLQAQTKSLTTPLGKYTRINYDAVTGLLTNIKFSGLEEENYTYDGQGRVTEVRQGERVTQYSYDTHGNLASATDPSNKTTSFTYDQRGRVVETAYADGHSSYFRYDANGNMLRLTTPTPADFEFTYNGVNKKISATSPLKKSTQYLYDKQRRLIQTVRPSGNSIKHSYVNGERSQTVTPERTYSYTYGCGGKMASVQSDTELIDYTYDGDLITQMKYTGILNASIGYTYNDFFQPNSITYANDLQVLDYDVDKLLVQSGGAAIERNVKNGLIESITDRSYVQTIANNSYGEAASSMFKVNGKEVFAYTIDERNAKGQILQKTEHGDKKAKTYSYTYDDVGRLLTVFESNKMIESYTYDTNGNRIHKEGYGLVPHPGKHLGANVEKNKGQGHYHLDEYQVKKVSIDSSYTVEDQLEKVGETLYAYDEDGYLSSRVTPRGTTQYHYGTLGELRSVVLENGTIIEYSHNANNQRVAKKVNGIITEKYLWQDLTTLLAIYDGNDNLIQRFEYAGRRTPYAMSHKGQRYYLAYDQVGTLKAIADEEGTIVKSIVYDTFGNIWEDSNPDMKIPFGFAGGLYDEDTRLTRFGYRDYDAETGKWTAKDPIGFDGGDTSLYGYVLGDPVNFVDPNGLWTVGFSLNFGYGAGIGGIHGLNLVFDSNGNFDSQWINGAGGYAGAGLGTTLGFEISNAECIDQLLGNGYQHGAGGGFGIIGEVGTFGGSGYQGGYLGIGAGAGLPVGYGFYGTVTQPVSFPDISADSLMLQGR